jgi:hypothetical protein
MRHGARRDEQPRPGGVVHQRQVRTRVERRADENRRPHRLLSSAQGEAMRARIIQIAVVPSRIHKDGQTVVTAEHLYAVDSDGNLHERFNNDEPGAWHPVEPPPRAKRTRANARNRRKA